MAARAHRWSLAGRRRVPRTLHPVAWWIWALGLATAASRTTNPLLLLLVLAVLGVVVANRRSDAPWARAFKYYLYLALTVVAIRVLFRSVFGGDVGTGHSHLLFDLPHVPLPSWAAGVQLGGPVTLEGTMAALYDGLRLGTLLCCLGAANALANPKRALRVLPGALYELGVAVVVTLSIAPQLVESVQRVRRARKLRGGAGARVPRPPRRRHPGHGGCPRALAAAGRGHGLARLRPNRGATPRTRRATGALLLGGMCGLCLGAYGLLDASAPGPLGLPALSLGAVLCCAGLALGSRRVGRTQYRPDPWKAPEWVVAASGIIPGRRPRGRDRLRPAPARSVGRSASLAVHAAGSRSGHRRRRGGRGGGAASGPAGADRGRPAGLAARDPGPRRRRRPTGSDRGAGMIEFDHVSVTYADARRPAIRDVCLAIDEGELALVVGRTGVGKSTLLGAINGLVPHFTGGTLAGRVTVDGRDTRTHRPRELADVVGVVGQDPLSGFVTDTVEEELAYGMEQLAVPPEVMRKRVEETLDLLGIADLRDRPLFQLSGGQQQRVAIGSVMTAHPRVLVLDEPTSALDPNAAEEVLAAVTRLVHDLGVTVVLAEHRLERVVQYADRVIEVGADGTVGGRPARSHAPDRRRRSPGGRARPPGPLGSPPPLGPRCPPGGGTAPSPAGGAAGSGSAARPRRDGPARPCCARAMSSSATGPSSPSAGWTSTWPVAR